MGAEGSTTTIASLLTLMMEAGSSSLRSLAAFHAGEIGFAVRRRHGPLTAVGQPALAREHADGR